MRNQKQGRQHGFTILEAVLALTILMMMTMLFAAVFPVAVRGAQQSNNYNQAVLLAQHKIDALRGAGFTVLQLPNGTTSLAGRGDIDPNSVSAGNGSSVTYPYTATFTAVDNLDGGTSGNGYFPPGSTGTIEVTDYHSGNAPSNSPAPVAFNASVPANQVILVTVTIQWSGGSTSSGSYSASALIPQVQQ